MVTDQQTDHTPLHETTELCEEHGHKLRGFGYSTRGNRTAVQCENCGLMGYIKNGSLRTVYDGWSEVYLDDE